MMRKRVISERREDRLSFTMQGNTSDLSRKLDLDCVPACLHFAAEVNLHDFSSCAKLARVISFLEYMVEPFEVQDSPWHKQGNLETLKCQPIS